MAVVLIRLVGTDQDGQPVKIASADLILSLGDLETGGERDHIYAPGTGARIIGQASKRPPGYYSIRPLSKESLDQGWFAMFLPPGYYYVGLATWKQIEQKGVLKLPPYWDEQFFVGKPEWRIEVPKGTPVLYAGTFLYSVQIVLGNWRAIDQNVIKVDDESQLAKEFSARELSSLPPPSTHLAVPHTGPHLLGVPTVAAD